MEISRKNPKLSQYLELLETDENDLDILRLYRESLNPAYLIENLIRERNPDEPKEIFALEYDKEEDHLSIPDKDANILAQLKTAKAVGMGERKVDVVNKNLVLTSKSFKKQMTDGGTKKVNPIFLIYVLAF